MQIIVIVLKYTSRLLSQKERTELTGEDPRFWDLQKWKVYNNYGCQIWVGKYVEIWGWRMGIGEGRELTKV